MEFLRSAQNPWGQDVLVGIGWDLVWIALIASVLFVVGHAAWLRLRSSGVAEEAPAPTAGVPSGVPERVERHTRASRAFHWSMSIAMLVLLVTAFVPVLGLQFPWVTIHWIAGLALVATVLYHVVHVVGWQDFWSMSMGPADVREGIAEMRHALGSGPSPERKPGKYPFDHKLYHHVVVVATVVASVTGVLMMVRIDTPFWTGNPYLFSDGLWGVMYVLHGLSGVALIGLVTAHVYFALRPEKRWITWSMVRGWIDRDRYLAHHDPERWVVAPATTPTEPVELAGQASSTPGTEA